MVVFDFTALQYVKTTILDKPYCRMHKDFKDFIKIDSTTMLKDFESGQVIKTFEDSESAPAIYFINDKFIIYSSDECDKIWDIKSDKYVSSINSRWEEEGYDCEPFDYTISENEKYVIALVGIRDCCTNSMHDSVDIYDLETGKWIAKLGEHEGFIDGLISLSENRLITFYGAYVKLWNIENGECIKKIEFYNQGGKESRCNIKVTKDEKYLISWYHMDESNISYIKFWDISSGQCIKVLSTSGDYILSVVVPSDYKFIFSLQPNCIKKWDTETCEVVGEINFPLIK
jgi:WD40 repeat protein